MDCARRVKALRALMREAQLDAYVVRRTSDLAWLTGFERVFDEEQAHTALVTQDACIIHTDSRYADAMRSRAAGAAGGGGPRWAVDDVCVRDGRRVDAAGFLAHALEEAGLADARAALDDQMPVALFRRMEEALPDASLVVRAGDMLDLRAVKEDAELALMRDAQACAEAGFTRLLEQLRPGMTEREASFALEFSIREAGADALSFPSIVAAGENGANPHAQPGERVFAEGELVVFDFGARLAGYCSDTTRTVCIGKPAPEQLRAYEAVREANAQVRRALCPDVTGAAMHELAEQVLADAGFARKMGHGLGHGVGLDIHERPCLSPRESGPLAAGAVVTVEPGVYVPGAFGVRIEDCGVVGEGGFENFCTLGHDLTIVE